MAVKVFPVDWTASMGDREAGDVSLLPSTDPWSAPVTAAGIHRATRRALDRAGALAGEIEGADAILVEVVDRFAPHLGSLLARLGAQASGMAGGLVVRLHGAFRDGALPRHHVEDTGLSATLETVQSKADWVLVSSRSHLIRLACAGPFDSSRVRLVPAAFEAGFTAQEGAEVLVCGETHRAALEPVLAMLKGDSGGSSRGVRAHSFRIARTARALDSRELTTGVALVPALSPFGDRSLVDALLRGGIPVVASELACRIDEPLPDALFPVESGASAAEWQAALAAARDWSCPDKLRRDDLDAALAAQLGFFQEACARAKGRPAAA